jgi:RND family efflux transporter MFP subunit
MAWRERFLLFGLTLLVAGCNDVASKEPEIRPVRTTVVDPRPIEDERRAVGEIRPRHESELGFRVAGKVVARTVDVGASVRRGELLAKLDDQDFRNRLKSAEADLVAAQAVLTEARGAEERLRQLLASGITTRAAYDAALKNFRSAEAKLESAESALDLAADQLRYAELHAEFDGIVTAVGAEPGQVVNSGRMVVRLARPGDKDAVFSVAESVFAGRDPDAAYPEIVVALSSNPAVAADGVVREVSPVADPATRTYQVKVTLRDAPEQMRFGASVIGRIKAATAPVVVLPASALFDQAGRPAVWVVDPSDGMIALKTVAVARYETDRVIVSGGLAKGDIVVTAGVNRLRQMQKVRFADGGAR